MRLNAAKVSEVYKKYPIDKMWFQGQKYVKYLKFKNDIKRPAQSFNKELWAIYVFLKFSQILKSSTCTENDVKINFEI